MRYSLYLTEEAIKDIESAAGWYDSKQEGVGSEFSGTVISYLEYLTGNAHSHPKVYKEYRELVMKRFPYVIVYRIEKEKEVIILGVIHTRKHPSSRRKRK